MVTVLSRSHTSTGAATLVGTVVGLLVVALYLGAGLLVADWSVSAFLAHLSLGTVAYLLSMIGLALTLIGLPVAVFLRFKLLAPLGVLGAVTVGWLALGLAQDILSVQTIFALTLYAAYFSPIAILLYVVFGGSEYLLRTGTASL